MRILARYGWLLCALLWCVACFAFFQCAYPYHFHFQEQTQLFLQSGDYVSTYFSKPAWVACVLGDYLTQFYYYRLAGPAILSVSLALLLGLIYASLRRIALRRWISLVASVLLVAVVTACSWHYAYRLSSVLALIGAALLFLATSFRGGHRVYYLGLPVVGIPIAFVLFGYGASLYAALLLLHTIVAGRQVLPRLLLVVLSFACISIFKRVYLLDVADLYAYPGMGKMGLPQMDLQREFAAMSEYRFGNYNRLASMVEQEERPSSGQLFYYNLVMARRGQLPDAVLRRPTTTLGTFYNIGPNSAQLVIQGMDELYWLLGDMTFSERAAILSNVFSPGNRSIVKVKRLAEVNLVTGDSLAARKYLRMLAKTAVWGEWAQELLAADSTSKAMKPYLEKRAMTNRKDVLRKNDHARVLLLELMESNPANGIALDYLLCSDLQAKDIRSFRQDFDRYYQQVFPRQPVHELYQQALCISLAADGASREDWHRYVQRTDVFEKFAAYNEHRGDPRFRDTYWYYYDKVEVKR